MFLGVNIERDSNMPFKSYMRVTSVEGMKSMIPKELFASALKDNNLKANPDDYLKRNLDFMWLYMHP
jgi:hypothetical protein